MVYAGLFSRFLGRHKRDVHALYLADHVNCLARSHVLSMLFKRAQYHDICYKDYIMRFCFYCPSITCCLLTPLRLVLFAVPLFRLSNLSRGWIVARNIET